MRKAPQSGLGISEQLDTRIRGSGYSRDRRDGSRPWPLPQALFGLSLASVSPQTKKPGRYRPGHRDTKGGENYRGHASSFEGRPTVNQGRTVGENGDAGPVMRILQPAQQHGLNRQPARAGTFPHRGCLGLRQLQHDTRRSPGAHGRPRLAKSWSRARWETTGQRNFARPPMRSGAGSEPVEGWAGSPATHACQSRQVSHSEIPSGTFE